MELKIYKKKKREFGIGSKALKKKYERIYKNIKKRNIMILFLC